MNAVSFKITPRDEEVLKFVLEGYDDRATTAGLGMSPRTVKQHMHSLSRRARIESGNKRVTLLRRLATPEKAEGGWVAFTARELRAVIDAADGKTNQEIADMGIARTAHGVRNLMRSVFDKCGVW
jgi:DNA-binding CsgD family transcriptional regulator